MRTTFHRVLRMVGVLFVFMVALLLCLWVLGAISADGFKTSLGKLVIVAVIAVVATMIVAFLVGVTDPKIKKSKK